MVLNDSYGLKKFLWFGKNSYGFLAQKKIPMVFHSYGLKMQNDTLGKMAQKEGPCATNGSRSEMDLGQRIIQIL